VEAHFPFEAGADNLVALARPAILINEEFGNQEQAQAVRPGCRVGQPREHEVENILRQVVLARRDEDLGPCYLVGAVIRGLGPRADQA
jgi:hypothetical protein